MSRSRAQIDTLLGNLVRLREVSGLSRADLERRLVLGPGWISRFETGETLPSVDVLLAVLAEIGGDPVELFSNLPRPEAGVAPIVRTIFAEPSGDDLTVRFTYANHDARHLLPRANVDDFETVVRALRDGLARNGGGDAQAIKTNAVAHAFRVATTLWPHANPSDLWWFVVYRAYCDPYNHPAQSGRLGFEQSWKRTAGWALEEILVRHYGPFLATKGIDIAISTTAEKRRIIGMLDLPTRMEADKIDVVLTGTTTEGPVFFGVVHVKASFAERRTDDVPMSEALSRAGYTSPLWTMDCKSMPGATPINRGELGEAGGDRGAKRRDIEDEGYFTGCFSYNANTRPSPVALPVERRIQVCDFNDPDDAFSRFIIDRWHAFRARRERAVRPSP